MVNNSVITNLRHNINSELYKLLYTGFVDSVYAVYEAMARGFPQGYCGQIAEAIVSSCGGELVAGYLEYGTGRRQHWWVVIDECIVDPMAEVFNKHTPCRHVEVHRNTHERYW